jgi:hypothetical protein
MVSWRPNTDTWTQQQQQCNTAAADQQQQISNSSRSRAAWQYDNISLML